MGFMKKLLILTTVSALFSLVVSSCGSSKGNCDAYGSTQTTENSDLATK
jgi:hypothetical protein